ncbi:MAG: hypothetical protein K6G18_14150 [Treponema sp.]|nr:hypothetical protein [Treponema sp.]
MKSFVLRLIKILAFLAIIAGSLAIMMFLPAKGFYKQGSRMLPDLGFMGTVLLVVSIILFIVGIFGFMAVLPNPKEGGIGEKLVSAFSTFIGLAMMCVAYLYFYNTDSSDVSLIRTTGVLFLVLFFGNLLLAPLFDNKITLWGFRIALVAAIVFVLMYDAFEAFHIWLAIPLVIEIILTFLFAGGGDDDDGKQKAPWKKLNRK